MSFLDIADRRFLASAKTLLGPFQWNVGSTYGEVVPSSTSLEQLLQLMGGRGLDPVLVSKFFDIYPARPFERALVAWDVARASLIGSDNEDKALESRVHAEIEPLKQFGGREHVAVPRDEIPALINVVRPAPNTVLKALDLESPPSLASLVQITDAARSLDDSPTVNAVLEHAKMLSVAHLPSLALAFLQILCHRFPVSSAIDLMVEIATDHGLLASIPMLSGQDERSVQRQAYVLLRFSMADDGADGGVQALDAMRGNPAVDSDDPSWFVARTELALLQTKKFDRNDADRMEALAPLSTEWRYLARVRDGVRIAASPGNAVEILNEFIARFGNDANLWRYAAENGASRDDLVTLMSRELRYASYDPEVWRGVAFLVGDDEIIADALAERLATQLQAALS